MKENRYQLNGTKITLIGKDMRATDSVTFLAYQSSIGEVSGPIRAVSHPPCSRSQAVTDKSSWMSERNALT